MGRSNATSHHSLSVLPVVLTALLAASGCARSGPPAGEVEAMINERASRAIPVVSKALAATVVEASGGWQSCPTMSVGGEWRYEVFTSITASEDKVPAQLEKIRSAMVEAGYADAKLSGDYVVATLGSGVSFNVRRAFARGEDKWTMSVKSACTGYDGADKKRVDKQEWHKLEGVVPSSLEE